jgi:hypothetical protein
MQPPLSRTVAGDVGGHLKEVGAQKGDGARLIML